MILTKSKQVKGMPQTSQINKETVVVVKLVIKIFSYSNMTSYNSRNKSALKTSNHAMKEGRKCRLKLGFR
jgi:hypothetical protein